MAKKKKNNPLEGIQRFDVAPNYVPEINKILGMRHRLSGAAHDKSLKDKGLSGGDGRNNWLKERWDRRADYLEKGLVTPYQWGSPSAGRRGPIDGDGNIIEYNVDEKGNRRTPINPDQWPDDYYSYGLSADRDAPEFERYGQEDARSGKIPRWVGNSMHPHNRSPLHKWGGSIDLSDEEMQQKIKGAYERSSSSVLNAASNSGKSKDSATKSKEATQRYYKEFWEKQKTEDPEAYAAHQKSLGKTGKVEEPALPQASEKPVAKKKKSEPEYVPSKSEKDFAAGRMPGITGTAEEAASALERTRKASTSKVTGKAKVKLQEEIAAHPMYRGTRQLSDEEVAANEAGDSAPKSTKKGSIRASESVAATAQTPKPKGKGKKAKTPATGSKEAVEAELATGTSTKRDAEFAEKDTREDAVVNTRTKAPQYPYDRLAEPVKRSETVSEYMARIQNVPSTQVVNDDSAIAGKGSTVPTAVPRSDSSGNTIDVSRFEGKPTAAETAEPDKNKPGYYREKFGALLDSMTPEEKAMSEAGMAAVRDREEAALDADEAERAGRSTPSSMPAPTAGTGMASPTPSWGAPTGAGVASPTAAPASPTPATPSAPPAGTGGPRSTPAPAPKVKGPGLGSRIGGFFGGHGGRGGGKAPTPAAGPSTSTSSANTTTINYGAPTFGDQTNLGRNDFGGGGGGAGGSGSINMSANSNQANQVQGQNVRIGGSYGGTVGGPVVASTSGRATSNNPRATVLSTGGPASQTQGHPRAQNAKRGGRPTTSNQTPTAPKTKNPRQQKP